MKKTFAFALASFLMVSSALAQAEYDADITPIFGNGNPITDWNKVSENGFVLGARAKERFVTPVMNHTNEVYYMPLQATPTNRSSFNLELSVQNLNGPVGQVDTYLKVDIDPSVGISYVTVNVQETWNDNAYGDASTGNGAGIDATAFTKDALAGAYSVMQLSQNIGFGEFQAMGVKNPAAASTYDYILYVVEKGSGPNAQPLASIQIQVVTGPGGASIADLVADIDTTGMSHGDYVNAVKAIAKYLFDGGVINNKEMAGLISTAAKSTIGK
jgi:hypothetical protein